MFRPEDFAELTTPALRATPPLRGGEYSHAKTSIGGNYEEA
jgi:hypothetical protein